MYNILLYIVYVHINTYLMKLNLQNSNSYMHTYVNIDLNKNVKNTKQTSNVHPYSVFTITFYVSELLVHVLLNTYVHNIFFI